MGRAGQTSAARGLLKANRQLLLAAELTFETDRAERLAELAHAVGRWGADEAPDRETVRSIVTRLEALRDGTHPDVDDAIVRAQELLTPYVDRPGSA